MCGDILQNVSQHSLEYNVSQIPLYVSCILYSIPVFRVLDNNKETVFLRT